jgi:hypothetical protein
MSFLARVAPRLIRLSGMTPGEREARLLTLPSAGLVLGVGGCLCLPTVAWGQDTSLINQAAVGPDGFTTLVTPVLDPDYTRDHNVAVQELPQPNYTAVGIPVGSFSLYPQAVAGVVADSNVYATDKNTKADIASVLRPSLLLRSVWSRHLLQVQVYDDWRNYLSQPVLNRNSWSVNPLTELNFGKRVVLHAEVQAGRYFENPYNSDVGPQAQVLSTYLRTAETLKAIYTGGRVRLTAAYDHQAYTFSTVTFTDGSSTDQSYRNRRVDRFSGQAEFALSPSVALYAATNADKISYSVAQNAANPLLSSNGQGVIGGITFDLAGVMRGAIGVGYSHRTYLDTFYRDVGAVSGQIKLDFFPYKRTTVSLLGQRLIQDSGLISSAYIDTRLSASADQQLRENLIVSVGGALAWQSYVGTEGTRSYRQIQTTVRYQASRWLGFRGELTYRSSQAASALLGNPFSGVAMGLGVIVRR